RPAARTWLKSPLPLVGPRGQRRARKRACRALSVLVASGIWAAPLPLMAAGDWEFDLAPGDGDIAQLEQPRDGYLEQEKFAVGCSQTELFVQRYSPAGNTPTSVVRFGGGVPVVIVWDKLDLPNTMWAYGATAETVIRGTLLAQTVSFQEIGRLERAPVTFDVGGADLAIKPILDQCAYGVRSKGIAGPADGGTSMIRQALDPDLPIEEHH